MRRFLNERNERFLYFLLSLGIAAVMWLYVAEAQNPVVPRTMMVDLHVRGVGSNLVVVQSPPSRVQVRLEGPRSTIAPLSPGDLDASVDLNGLGPGDHRVPVFVAVPPEVHVVERTPVEVLVELDTLAYKRVPVQADLTGTPPEGVVVGTPRLSPASVLVSGPTNAVGGVRQALISMDTTNLHQQTVASLPVRVLDVNGQDVKGLTIQPSTIEASLPVREGVITKVVPIVPTIVGTPPPPLAVTGAVVTPDTVTVTGPGVLLRDVQSVPTVAVDISRAQGDISYRRVRLQIPPRVSAAPRQAQVVIHIGRALLSTVFQSVPVTVTGLAAGIASQVTPDKVDIQVEGPQDLVARLTNGAVTVEVNATGWAPGEYTIVPHVALPAGVRLLSIRPARVNVSLKST